MTDPHDARIGPDARAALRQAQADLAAAEEELGPFVADNAALRAEIEKLDDEMDRTIEATNHELTRLRAEIVTLRNVGVTQAEEIEKLNKTIGEMISEKLGYTDVATLRAQLDATRAGLVEARACLARAMLRSVKGPSALDVGEWAGIHSELFCGVRDADQVLASLSAQPNPTVAEDGENSGGNARDALGRQATGSSNVADPTAGLGHPARTPDAADKAGSRNQPSSKAYRLVPVDPTPEMVEAGRTAMEPEKFVSHARVLWVWEDMLNAAPTIPSPPPPGVQDDQCDYCWGFGTRIRFGGGVVETCGPCGGTGRRPATPKPASEEVERIWHLGAMNDGLFIINRPPRPGAVDDGPWDNNPNGPDLVLNVTDLPKIKAQAIVDAHNAALLRISHAKP